VLFILLLKVAPPGEVLTAW